MGSIRDVARIPKRTPPSAATVKSPSPSQNDLGKPSIRAPPVRNPMKSDQSDRDSRSENAGGNNPGHVWNAGVPPAPTVEREPDVGSESGEQQHAEDRQIWSHLPETDQRVVMRREGRSRPTAGFLRCRPRRGAARGGQPAEPGDRRTIQSHAFRTVRRCRLAPNGRKRRQRGANGSADCQCDPQVPWATTIRSRIIRPPR